jgi:hypothetical protein
MDNFPEFGEQWRVPDQNGGQTHGGNPYPEIGPTGMEYAGGPTSEELSDRGIADDKDIYFGKHTTTGDEASTREAEAAEKPPILVLKDERTEPQGFVFDTKLFDEIMPDPADYENVATGFIEDLAQTARRHQSDVDTEVVFGREPVTPGQTDEEIQNSDGVRLCYELQKGPIAIKTFAGQDDLETGWAHVTVPDGDHTKTYEYSIVKGVLCRVPQNTEIQEASLPEPGSVPAKDLDDARHELWKAEAINRAAERRWGPKPQPVSKEEYAAFHETLSSAHTKPVYSGDLRAITLARSKAETAPSDLASSLGISMHHMRTVAYVSENEHPTRPGLPPFVQEIHEPNGVKTELSIGFSDSGGIIHEPSIRLVRTERIPPPNSDSQPTTRYTTLEYYVENDRLMTSISESEVDSTNTVINSYIGRITAGDKTEYKALRNYLSTLRRQRKLQNA